MGSKKISWKRILLIVLIVAFSALGGALIRSSRPDMALLPALAAVLSALWLMADIRRNERSIDLFFDSVSGGDFSTTFDESEKNLFLRSLHIRMNQFSRKIRELRIRNEISEKYYRSILEQSATGLVVMNDAHEIEVINRAAARFAGISPDSTDRRLMKIRNPVLFEQLKSMVPGENITYRGHGPGPDLRLLLKAIEIEMSGKRLKVVTIENIRRELDQTELESYQRLIRVLTHEIMNSVAPLTSVSGTLQKRFYPDQKPIDPAKIDKKLIHALVHGLSTIDDQTKGMAEFVNNYRKLTKLPEPAISPMDVTEWMEMLKILLADEMEGAGIEFHMACDSGIRMIHADKNLLNQVMMNLVNNARDALKSTSGERELRIELFRYDPGHIYIKVSNNGPGIPEEDLEKIFIPFYTTKTAGSGIGLYISRQIIQLHHGLLSVSSRTGETSFLIELPDRPVNPL